MEKGKGGGRRLGGAGDLKQLWATATLAAGARWSAVAGGRAALTADDARQRPGTERLQAAAQALSALAAAVCRRRRRTAHGQDAWTRGTSGPSAGGSWCRRAQTAGCETATRASGSRPGARAGAGNARNRLAAVAQHRRLAAVARCKRLAAPARDGRRLGSRRRRRARCNIGRHRTCDIGGWACVRAVGGKLGIEPNCPGL